MMVKIMMIIIAMMTGGGKGKSAYTKTFKNVKKKYFLTQTVFWKADFHIVNDNAFFFYPST